jgi:hypothetical protein
MPFAHEVSAPQFPLLLERVRVMAWTPLHPLVTDTKGNLAEKQEASGHKSQSMMNIYNVKPSVVKPAKE